MTSAVTEDEAKKRWCPFVRVSNGPDGSWNTMQDARSEQTYFCRASACMAWRKTGSKCRNRVGSLVDRDIDGTGAWIDIGYCGLAGAPGAPT